MLESHRFLFAKERSGALLFSFLWNCWLICDVALGVEVVLGDLGQELSRISM